MPQNPGSPDAPALRLLAADRPLVIGHRGYCEFAPENTLPSFALALESGADLVELDYHHSRDGVPLVVHDATLDRTTDASAQWRRRRIGVSRTDSSEITSLDAGVWFHPNFLGTRVPRLAEALQFIVSGGGIPLIEQKSGDAETCVQLLQRMGLVNRVVVISFDWEFLTRFHEMEPNQVLGALGPPTHLVNGKRSRRCQKRLDAAWLDAMSGTGARLVVWNRQVSAAAIELAHGRGLKVWVYTVDKPATARDLARRGVDGIITNEIGTVQKALFTRRWP